MGRIEQVKEGHEKENEEEKGCRNREGSAEATLWLSGEVEDEQALPAALCMPKANQRAQLSMGANEQACRRTESACPSLHR